MQKFRHFWRKKNLPKIVTYNRLAPSHSIISLTKCEGRSARIWTWGLDSTDRVQRSVQKRQGTDILPLQFWASLVNKRFITQLKVYRQNVNIKDWKHITNCHVYNFNWELTSIYLMLTKLKQKGKGEEKGYFMWKQVLPETKPLDNLVKCPKSDTWRIMAQ